MPVPNSQPATPASCHIRAADCITALGDSRETHARLLRGERGLEAVPVLMGDGGDPVPMALRGGFRAAPVPRWWEDLKRFLAPVAGAGWGGPDSPVFLAGSNFGIDALYCLGKERNPDFTPFATAHGCVESLRSELGWGGNCFVLSHACVSAQIALERAAAALVAGDAGRALVVAFDFLGPFVSAGFHALKILNNQFPAPFAEREAGSIGLGDGAAYVVLDRKPSRFRIGGQSTFNEMYHFTGNEPQGSGFREVLAPLAGLLRDRKVWVKGHGTGTLDAGRLEATMVGELLPGAPLVSWKGSIGHTLGSCAAVELAIALRAIEHGEAPGTVCSEPPFFAPCVGADNFATSGHNAVLLLCNAFGGAHAALLLDYA